MRELFSCSLTAKAGEALARGRFVKFSAAADAQDPLTVVYADAGDDAIGVTRDVSASGDMAAIVLLNAGVLLAESGATLAAGAKCYVGADGKLAATGSGQPLTVLEVAASGDLVKVLPPAAIARVNGFTANIETLTGTKALAASDDFLQVLDPDGARTVELPPEAEGLHYVIVNEADMAEDITVKEDAGSTTIATVSQGETGAFWCDGTTWHAIVASTT